MTSSFSTQEWIERECTGGCQGTERLPATETRSKHSQEDRNTTYFDGLTSYGLMLAGYLLRILISD
ncbi:hypothetical protein HPP92_012867 [Vanilla planifolia]|uniref:Uncharacterized protein n=1 Tax=Vanilla planifolia TaxID=51239 RepID=A0A835UY95_VANPL|nr:hypothetical protein HPP92_012867 [Vanilla planifolia]